MSILTDLNDREKQLLLEAIVSQGYTKEIISLEISDFENGAKRISEEKYKELCVLFDRLFYA